jgi:hypothetical protein
MKQKGLQPKVCKYSGCTRGEDGGPNTFTPHSRQHLCCHYTCAIEYTKEEKQRRKEKSKRLELKKYNQEDISYMLKQTQDIFNRYIRLRDKHLPCVSCGHTGDRQRHAGHFRPVGRNSQHRFNPLNAHSQCSICNNHMSGNLVQYREELIKRIGQKALDQLETDNTPKKWTIEELQAIQDEYKAMCRELE